MRALPGRGANQASQAMLHAIDEHEALPEESLRVSPLHHENSQPITLEGSLLCRKGKATGHATFLWKRKRVWLSLKDGGSISVYRDDSGESTEAVFHTHFSTLHRSLTSPRGLKETEALELFIPSYVSWVAKDVDQDPATFVIEVSTSDEDYSTSTLMSHSAHAALPLAPPRRSDEVLLELANEMQAAHRRHRPVRIYFKCNRGCNEKGLWLEAFSRLGRLSSETRHKKNLLASLTWKPLQRKTRDDVDERFAQATRDLDRDTSSIVEVDVANDVEGMIRGNEDDDKEFRVLPNYAYPHRWMTRSEMREEMLLPSTVFHNLRVPTCSEKEVGSIRVEVLQCLGLPKLDRASSTDAIVYMVCGSYAFSTDVIPNRVNPMWLRKARRACDFPLFHGYAKLYIGVFDDDGRKEKDEFAGRVVIDLSRLRPRSTYDVTLPLRLSTHVYARRQRGAIRLRFTLNWRSEKDALMSYIPEKIHIPLPQHSKPNTSTTVACGDPKSFRNVAITVHGAHMPNRFTFQQMRAVTREINLTRKYIFLAVRQEIKETRHWHNPFMSAYVFFSWMHCIYINSFALVPAYVVLYGLLQLMRTYVKYAIDSPSQRGFVPPTWEEMLMALIRGHDPTYQAFEPIELGLRPKSLSGHHSPTSITAGGEEPDSIDWTVSTHKPLGKRFFRGAGFMGNKDDFFSVEDDHLEFPFGNGADFPKFAVHDCLAHWKNPDCKGASDTQSLDGQFEVQVSRGGDMRVLPKFGLELEMPELMRRDSSGMNDCDVEERKFVARKAVIAKGKAAGLAAASTLKTTTDLVVYPIRAGMHQVQNLVVDHSDVQDGPIRASQRLLRVSQRSLPRSRSDSIESELTDDDSASYLTTGHASGSVKQDANASSELHDETGSSTRSPNSSHEDSEAARAKEWPEQNIDIEGPSTGKKLTDDLADIKDKMHEMSWHLFDDRNYKVHSKSLYFGDSKKPEKRRKKSVSKSLDKLLQVGQYSHSNPLVSRVGLYVEPIIGSVYSFLCIFRAGFNVVTWRDPMLTFWLSFFGGILCVVLFIFPWRIFLFLFGLFLVGPQNWAIRVLRECGKLPPPKKKEHKHDKPREEPNLKEQPVFQYLRKPQMGEVPLPEIQQVVVPYTPLIYHRFYDWPPEPQYAQVKKQTFAEGRRFVPMALSRQSPLRHLRSKSSPVSPPARRHRRSLSGDWVPENWKNLHA